MPIPPWIFLRGLMRDSRHWGPFPSQFREHFPQARIEVIDLPGNGERYRERSPARVPAMADFCREVLQQRNLEPPYRVLAMSLGAMVAVDWFTRHPQEVQAAVLINTSLRPFSPFHHRLRPVVYAPLLRLLLSQPDEQTIERTILELTSRHRDRTSAVVNDWVTWRKSHPVSRANALRQLIAAARFRAPASAPPVPVLLLTSRCDGLVDTRCSQQLAATWGCPLVEHPSAGHDLPLDDGAWVADQVARWLARTEAAGI